MKFIFLLSFLFSSCASKPQQPVCPEASVTVSIPKSEADKIQGNVTPFLTDAMITEEYSQITQSSSWRFSKMATDSVYYLIGLREGDSIYKTNLGPQSNFMNLVSDLSGIPSGTTNCLYIRAKDNTERVVKILVEKK